MSFFLLLPKRLNYLAFQSSDFKGKWWRLSHKCFMSTTFDIYVFIISLVKSDISFVYLLSTICIIFLS
jgi:hypothetical protein